MCRSSGSALAALGRHPLRTCSFLGRKRNQRRGWPPAHSNSDGEPRLRMGWRLFVRRIRRNGRSLSHESRRPGVNTCLIRMECSGSVGLCGDRVAAISTGSRVPLSTVPCRRCCCPRRCCRRFAPIQRIGTGACPIWWATAFTTPLCGLAGVPWPRCVVAVAVCGAATLASSFAGEIGHGGIRTRHRHGGAGGLRGASLGARDGRPRSSMAIPVNRPRTDLESQIILESPTIELAAGASPLGTAAWDVAGSCRATVSASCDGAVSRRAPGSPSERQEY